MSMMIQEQTQLAPPVKPPEFTYADDGLPIFLGQTDEEHSLAWDEVDREVSDGQWKLAAIAASLESKRGEATVIEFAKAKKISASTVRSYARAYRVFGRRKRIVSVPFSLHHLAAERADNPVRAIKIAADKKFSYREFKTWIYQGEGRGLREAPKPAADDQPEVIDVEVSAAEEEHAHVEDEPIAEQEREEVREDIELGFRLVAAAKPRIKSPVILRALESLEEELDFQLEALTKLPSALPDRVESVIRGGCWIPDQIMQRARIKNAEDLTKICLKLERDGKIKRSRAGKRKHGTAPKLWMPHDMPDGSEFDLPRSGPQPDFEDSEEHY